MKKTIKCLAMIFFWWMVISMIQGCFSWTAYNRVSYCTDPNTGQWVVKEKVGIGRIDIATDVKTNSMSFKAPDGREYDIGGYEKKEDSIKANVVLPSGTPLGIETTN